MIKTSQKVKLETRQKSKSIPKMLISQGLIQSSIAPTSLIDHGKWKEPVPQSLYDSRFLFFLPKIFRRGLDMQCGFSGDPSFLSESSTANKKKGIRQQNETFALACC